MVLGVAEPGVDDAMTANEGFAPVDHTQLAVVAVVHHAQVANGPFVKELDPATVVTQALHHGFADFLGTHRIEHHSHLLAGAGALAQRVGQALTKHAILPQEGLEVHRVLRRRDALQQHVKERSVL